MSKTRIIDAVRHLDLDETRNLLTADPALLTVTDRQGRNLLHLACSVYCPALNLPESAAEVARCVLERLEMNIGRLRLQRTDDHRIHDAFDFGRGRIDLGDIDGFLHFFE